MKKIGLVGLGIMGRGMAHNFLKHNYPIYIWNRTRSVCDEFEKLGAVVCDSPAEVTKNADIIFEITANDESSKAVWEGEKGILSTGTPEKILILDATVSVAWTDELFNKCKEKGLRFMDMPLTGGSVGAETGNMTLLVGGAEENLEEIREVLGAVSGKIFHFGPEGHGMRFKLVLNYLQGLHMVGFGQAMKIAKNSGMDLEAVADALADRPGGAITGIAKEAYFKDEIPLTFSIEWITKDVTYAKEMAENLDVPLLDEVVKEYKKVMDAGHEGEDWAFVNSDK